MEAWQKKSQKVLDSQDQYFLITKNPIDMKKSLKKLSLLEGDYKVLPGHNMPTTLDFERKMNPYMKNI